MIKNLVLRELATKCNYSVVNHSYSVVNHLLNNILSQKNTTIGSKKYK